MQLEGFAEKKVQNLLDSIEAAKHRPLDRVIAALGIEGVGSTVAVDLANHFGSMDALASATVEELDAIEGIGEALAQSIAAWFADPYHQSVLDKLRRAGVNMQAEAQEKAGNQLEGLTFVLTGTLPTLSREQASELIEAHGGKVIEQREQEDQLPADGRIAGEQSGKSRQTRRADHQRGRSENA